MAWLGALLAPPLSRWGAPTARVCATHLQPEGKTFWLPLGNHRVIPSTQVGGRCEWSGWVRCSLPHSAGEGCRLLGPAPLASNQEEKLSGCRWGITESSLLPKFEASANGLAGGAARSPTEPVRDTDC